MVLYGSPPTKFCVVEVDSKPSHLGTSEHRWALWRVPEFNLTTSALPKIKWGWTVSTTELYKYSIYTVFVACVIIIIISIRTSLNFCIKSESLLAFSTEVPRLHWHCQLYTEFEVVLCPWLELENFVIQSTKATHSHCLNFHLRQIQSV